MTLPSINALLNTTASLLLVCGLVAIKSGRRELHARLMFAAACASAAFLACYLYYHFAIQTTMPYRETGWKKSAYLVLLLTHTVLAVVNVPLVLRTFWLAHREDWERHKRWAKITFPVWLYVSVTGVVIYFVLYHWNPAAPAAAPLQ
ncbi:MAG: DUF420 domain-containing protein [Planctomycetota bacterium]|nr:MAG: DUF420 domain-containing protein [Planctomycetota bacterium]